jgi:hypothetical protein
LFQKLSKQEEDVMFVLAGLDPLPESLWTNLTYFFEQYIHMRSTGEK